MFLFSFCLFNRELINSWEEYYQDSSYVEYKDGKIIDLDSANQNIYVHDSNFLNLQQDVGGAIMVQSDEELKILVEKSQFYKCSANSLAGTIYLNTGSSSSVLDSICA